ncbi:MAG: hypothetical protein ACI9N9_000025 [Enterobacterales bacterium]|jgi:hypothetical protein
MKEIKRPILATLYAFPVAHMIDVSMYEHPYKIEYPVTSLVLGVISSAGIWLFMYNRFTK